MPETWIVFELITTVPVEVVVYPAECRLIDGVDQPAWHRDRDLAVGESETGSRRVGEVQGGPRRRVDGRVVNDQAASVGVHAVHRSP